MALVERLMGLEGPKIPVHSFFAANHERIEGQLTRQQVIDIFQLNASAVAEYDAIAATAPTGTDALATARKAMFINQIHAVFLLAEAEIPGYNTPALVRARLGI